jgi:hypothetical protein
MDEFDYSAPAEVYLSAARGSRPIAVKYRRFDRSADAIRFAVEELEPLMQRGTAMEVGEERFEFAQIRALYDSEQYPLNRSGEGE